jgi:hypothetical protein
MVPVELLRQLIRYEPETGKLFWLPRSADLVKPGRNGAEIEAQRFNARLAGKQALNHLDARGYLVGALFARFLAAHRAAWAIHTGAWPNGQIDHINGVRSENQFNNLREVSAAENARNARRRKDNVSGFVGVYWREDQRRWGASIRFNNRLKHLGFFETAEEAGAARKAAQQRLGFHPNHGRH